MSEPTGNPARTEDRLHSALTEIGAGLPEPGAPEHLRRRIAAMPAPDAARAPWHGVGTLALTAAAAGFAVLSGVMLIQNQRLHDRLDDALAMQQAEAGTALPARAEIPPLVAVRFFHPQCPVAQAVAPRFEEIERTHCNEQVLFVSLDISESKEAQSAKLAGALDCDFVFSCNGTPVTSGMVVLADTRTKQVIKASHDTTDLAELEQALDSAILACSERGPGG